MTEGLCTRLYTGWRRRPVLSWLTLVGSVVLTLLAWDVAKRSVDDRVHDQFSRRTDEIALAVAHRMQEHESVLRGAVALFLASANVTRQEFRLYFQHLRLDHFYPGIQGVGFAKLVGPSNLEQTIAEIRSEGFSEFTVYPDGMRDLYTPVVLIEPFSGRNARAFGFDMYSEQSRRHAIRRAAESGQPSASEIVRLIQETNYDTQPGFLLYLPVFRGGGETPAQRAANLIGFVYSPLRIRDMMHGIFERDPSDLDYALFEQAAIKPFFDTRTPSTSQQSSAHTREQKLDVAGRVWSIRFWSRPSFGGWVSRWEPRGVLFSGLIINVLLFYILGASASLQSRAEALALVMTDELKLSHAREQQQMMSSLKEKETLVKEIHHRVKNNLQVVSSLLSLQHSYAQDERSLLPLQQSQQRVLAMAALHEFLYQAKELSRVDTRAYLSHLVSVLAETNQSDGRVAVRLELDEIALDVDHAIPCGLITNELVSNAFKYAYREGRTGCLTVGLRRVDRQIVLSVEDDGPGLSEPLTEAPSTLGLSLVQLLAQQLQGSVAVTSAPGARFVITFPAEARGSTA